MRVMKTTDGRYWHRQLTTAWLGAAVTRLKEINAPATVETRRAEVRMWVNIASQVSDSAAQSFIDVSMVLPFYNVFN